MFVGYLPLDKDPAMYAHQTSVTRHPGLSISPQNYPVPPPPQYTDFSSYHHHGLGNDPAQQAVSGAGGWYPPPPTRDEWSPHHYVPPISAPHPGSNVPGPSLEFSQPEGPPSVTQLSPQRRNPYDWIRRSAPLSNPNGKTRTKDKYRVVYTDHQRLELEKEFHYSKYITIRRKAELATSLNLSERQVKIWFQNRRAKERKINKKKLQQPAPSTTTPTPPSGGSGGGLHSNNGTSNVAMVSSSSGLVSPSSLPLNIKEEF